MIRFLLKGDHFMALTTGPLLSIGASGTLAKTLTYSHWKGRPYARQRVIPMNPQTAEQTKTRDVFRFLVASHKQQPAQLHDDLEYAGRLARITGLNEYTKANLRNIRSATDLNSLVFMPGAYGGLAIVSMTAVAGANSIDVTIVPPPIPPSWTLNYAELVILSDQDPHNVFTGKWFAHNLTTGPWTFTFTGLTTAQVYQVGAYLDWTQPNGARSLSPSIQAQATPT